MTYPNGFTSVLYDGGSADDPELRILKQNRHFHAGVRSSHSAHWRLNDIIYTRVFLEM